MSCGTQPTDKWGWQGWGGGGGGGGKAEGRREGVMVDDDALYAKKAVVKNACDTSIWA